MQHYLPTNGKTLFENDSTFVHKLANKLHATDSVKAITITDSVIKANQFTFERLHPLKKTDTVKVKQVPSVFTNHELKAHNINPQPSAASDNTAMVIITVMAVFLIALIRQYNDKRLAGLFNAFKASRFATQLQREEYSLNNRAALTLLIVFVITISVFVIQVCENNGIVIFSPIYWEQFATVAAVIILIYTVKILSINIIGFLFDNMAAAKEYVFNILLFNQVAGILLLPMIMVLLFSAQINPTIPIYAVVIFLLFIFFFRIIRTISALQLRQRISIIYIFLYLCTLEIMPVLFVVKYIQNNYN